MDGRGLCGTWMIPMSLKGELDIGAGAWVGIGWMCFGDKRAGGRRYRSFIGDSLQRSQEHTAWVLEGWAYREQREQALLPLDKSLKYTHTLLMDDNNN